MNMDQNKLGNKIPLKKKKERLTMLSLFLECLIKLIQFLNIVTSLFINLFRQIKEFTLHYWLKIKEFMLKIWLKIRKFILKIWIKIRKKIKPRFIKIYNFLGKIILYIISVNYLHIIKFYFFDKVIRLLRGIHYFIIDIIKNSIQGFLMLSRYLRLQIINLLFKLIKPSIYLIIILTIIYYVDYYDQ